MSYRFKNFSVFGDSGRKFDFQTDATLEGESNSTQIIVDGDVPGASEGVETSSASIDMAICLGGKDSSQHVFDLYKQKKYADYVFGPIDGRILTVKMMVKSFKYAGKAADGTTTFSCSLVGGAINKVG